MRSTARGRNDGKPPALVPLAGAPSGAEAAVEVEAVTLTRALDDAASSGGSAGREVEVRSSGIWPWSG